MNVLITALLPREVVATIEREHRVEMNLELKPMAREKLLAAIDGKDGLLCSIADRIDGELLSRAPGLKILANYGVGYDHVDLEAATRMGIPVTNTPGVLTDATADIAFALILATSRRMIEGDRIARAGEFKFWSPLNFLGRQVTGKTLGIVGFGRIGKAMAKRAAGFDMRVIYHSRTRLELSEEKQLRVEYVSFEELLGTADFVSLHVPLSPKTRHLVGARELKLMKPTAVLINTARGPVLDEIALVEALRNGIIGGAGLDVYENEPELAPGLAELENAVFLPHVGSATIETRTLMAVMAANNLLAGLRGEKPPNCLNWDAVRGGK